MSDPLTALMHAVQVMNLLKTLIMKTLREREEAASGGYSPMSSRSSNQRSEYNYDSQQEEMDTSCELRGGPASDYEDDQADNYCSTEEEEEVEEEEIGSLGEVEECFLRRLDETETTAPSGNSFLKKQTSEDSQSLESCSAVNAESGISLTDSAQNGTSLLTTTSDGEEDSGTSRLISESRIVDLKTQMKEPEVIRDEQMVESSSPVPILV
ncbi:hypothetical protein CRG98_009039, partial [Punica granatum]